MNLYVEASETELINIAFEHSVTGTNLGCPDIDRKVSQGCF